MMAVALAARNIGYGARMHPGHGPTEPTSWLHYLTEPVHSGIALVVAIASAIVALAVWRKWRAKVD